MHHWSLIVTVLKQFGRNAACEPGLNDVYMWQWLAVKNSPVETVKAYFCKKRHPNKTHQSCSVLSKFHRGRQLLYITILYPSIRIVDCHRTESFLFFSHTFTDPGPHQTGYVFSNKTHMAGGIGYTFNKSCFLQRISDQSSQLLLQTRHVINPIAHRIGK